MNNEVFIDLIDVKFFFPKNLFPWTSWSFQSFLFEFSHIFTGQYSEYFYYFSLLNFLSLSPMLWLLPVPGLAISAEYKMQPSTRSLEMTMRLSFMRCDTVLRRAVLRYCAQNNKFERCWYSITSLKKSIEFNYLYIIKFNHLYLSFSR